MACFALLSAYLVSVGESPCGTHWCFCEDRWWRSLLHRHTGHLESLSGGRACIRFFSLIGLFVFFDSLVRGVYVDRMQVLEVCMSCQYLLLLCDSPFDLIVSFDQQTFFILTESRVVITSFVVTLSVSCLRDACLSGGHIGGPLHSL